MCSAISSERSRIAVHDSELDAVSDALRQLRGKFYAERRKNLPNETPEQMEPPLATVVDKDELRRRSGLKPGKPAPHS